MTGNNGLEILSYTSPGTEGLENCCKPRSGIPLWMIGTAALLQAVKGPSLPPSLSQPRRRGHSWGSAAGSSSAAPRQPQLPQRFFPAVLQPCWSPHWLPRGYKLKQSHFYCLPLPPRSSILILCHHTYPCDISSNSSNDSNSTAMSC